MSPGPGKMRHLRLQRLGLNINVCITALARIAPVDDCFKRWQPGILAFIVPHSILWWALDSWWHLVRVFVFYVLPLLMFSAVHLSFYLTEHLVIVFGFAIALILFICGFLKSSGFRTAGGAISFIGAIITFWYVYSPEFGTTMTTKLLQLFALQTTAWETRTRTTRNTPKVYGWNHYLEVYPTHNHRCRSTTNLWYSNRQRLFDISSPNVNYTFCQPPFPDCFTTYHLIHLRLSYRFQPFLTRHFTHLGVFNRSQPFLNQHSSPLLSESSIDPSLSPQALFSFRTSYISPASGEKVHSIAHIIDLFNHGDVSSRKISRGDFFFLSDSEDDSLKCYKYIL